MTAEYHVQGDIAVITLSNPPVNGLGFATRLGIAGELLHAAAPRITQIIMNTTFRMFPDSAAAKGEKLGKPTLSPEAIAMAQMMRGIHF
jgi:hypothetical protein